MACQELCPGGPHAIQAIPYIVLAPDLLFLVSSLPHFET